MKGELPDVGNRFIPAEISIKKIDSADIVTSSLANINDPNAGEWDLDKEP